MMNNKGFGTREVTVESRNIQLPYGETVVYKQKNSNILYCDLEHLTELLGINYILTESGQIAFIPDAHGTGIKITKVIPENGKFKNIKRRVINSRDFTVLLKVAEQQGDEVAAELNREMVLSAMKLIGIQGGVIQNGKLIPVHENGHLLEEFSFELKGDVTDYQ